ncbi:MAG TPA: hypothetical protein VN914_04975, partial [Polyangia bacterium]|nr:hypothetical protein [Polyangia bacterium]
MSALACTAANPAYRHEGRGHDAGGDDADSGPAFKGGDAAASGNITTCGTATPALDALVAVDSLAIDRRGNIYFSNDDGSHAFIGKLTPRGAADKHWLAIPLGLPTRGMAIDDGRGVIYFTAGTAAPELQAADLDGTPQARTVARGLVDPNDLVVGFDGNVYVSDQGDGQVYSFSPDGRKRTKVTGSAIGLRSNGTGPAGLAFARDGTLVVGYKGTGPLIRLSLGAGIEIGRGSFGPINDWINGLAYD